MTAIGAFGLLALALVIAAPLVLYALVRGERGGQVMNRKDAEHAARRDTDETDRY